MRNFNNTTPGSMFKIGYLGLKQPFWAHFRTQTPIGEFAQMSPSWKKLNQQNIFDAIHLVWRMLSKFDHFGGEIKWCEIQFILPTL